MSEPILSEVYSILMRKFDWRTAEIDETLEEYALDIFMVEFTGALRGICRDPKDDMVLECAESSGAEVIVTGDKDLLAVGEYEGIRILTPRAFLDEFSRPDQA
jgi:putative PIN family toxin of toxin-antitoxin system